MPTRYKMMLDKLSLKTANPQARKRENITIYILSLFLVAPSVALIMTFLLMTSQR